MFTVRRDVHKESVSFQSSVRIIELWIMKDTKLASDNTNGRINNLKLQSEQIQLKKIELKSAN